MTAPRWTPGPWVVKETIPNLDVISDHAPRSVAGAYPGLRRDANAHLIASAPDLYASLRTLVTLHEEECSPDCVALTVARAALRRARGEES